MSESRNEDTSKFPVLGRLLVGIDEKRNVNRVVNSLYVICALLFAADFFYDKHVTLGIEKIPGFYALYGFFMCAALVISARWMRTFLMRREDFYAPNDVDAEDYPEDQMERIDYDG